MNKTREKRQISLFWYFHRLVAFVRFTSGEKQRKINLFPFFKYVHEIGVATQAALFPLIPATKYSFIACFLVYRKRVSKSGYSEDQLHKIKENSENNRKIILKREKALKYHEESEKELKNTSKLKAIKSLKDLYSAYSNIDETLIFNIYKDCRSDIKQTRFALDTISKPIGSTKNSENKVYENKIEPDIPQISSSEIIISIDKNNSEDDDTDTDTEYDIEKEDKSKRVEDKELRILYKIFRWQRTPKLTKVEFNPVFHFEQTKDEKEWNMFGGVFGRENGLDDDGEGYTQCRLCCFFYI